MIKIEIDQEVFDFLQKEAIPLVDSPNTVLRRLLLKDRREMNKLENRGRQKGKPEYGDSKTTFIKSILTEHFDDDFATVSPYSMLFKSSDVVIYFQNFNKKSNNLWYRLKRNPLDKLKTFNKKAYVCLTCPPENLAYLIPLENITQKLKEVNYIKDDLEVNIDFKIHRWRELEWNLSPFIIK